MKRKWWFQHFRTILFILRSVLPWIVNPVFCGLSIDILSFFEFYKDYLYKNCTDFRKFSHCQEHYLFQFDSSTKQCHSYYHEKCNWFVCFVLIIDLHDNFTDVTMTFTLTTDRLNRLPLQFKRWKGPMSLAIQLDEEELPKVARIISKNNRKIFVILCILRRILEKIFLAVLLLLWMEHLYYTTAVLLSMNYAILQLNLSKQPILW